MIVQIPEKNNQIEFPDGMSPEEIKGVIDSNWDSIPVRKGVFAKSGEILSSIPGKIVGLYNPRIGHILGETAADVGKTGLGLMGVRGEDQSVIQRPGLVSSHPKAEPEGESIQYEGMVPSHRPPERKETISSFEEEPPGFLKRVFSKTEMTPKDRAKASNIVGLAEASGLQPSYIEKNYDAITQNAGIRGVPTTGELVNEVMQWSIKIGIGMKPLKTVLAVASFMGVKEAESVATQIGKGESVKLGAGREAKEFLGPLKEHWEIAADVAEFGVPAIIAGGASGLLKIAASKIRDPKQREIFTKDVQEESAKTGKPVNEVVVDKIEPTFDLEKVRVEEAKEAPKAETPTATPAEGEKVAPALPGEAPRAIGEGKKEPLVEGAKEPPALEEAKPPLIGEGEKVSGITPERQAYLDGLVEQVKGLDVAGRIRVDKLPTEEQQYLVGKGVVFDTDRMGKPIIGYSEARRVQDLREKVSGKESEAPINDKMIKDFNLDPNDVRNLKAIWKEDPAEFDKIIRSYRDTMIRDFELKREDKRRQMTDEEMFPEPKKQGNLWEKKKEKKTNTFLSWVKGKGGIWDESLPGETREFGQKESGIPGIISKEKGRPFDELMSQAKTEGWIDKDATEKDFFDALRRDIQISKGEREGERIYGGMFAETGGFAKRPTATEYSTGAKQARRIEMPELVEFYQSLSSGKLPHLAEKLRLMMGKALGQFNPRTGEVTMRRDLFADITQAEKVLSHEIGHLADWLPDKYIKRGNILGHIGSLRNYIKTLLEEYPKDTTKTYGIIEEFERNKLRKEAERQAASPTGEGQREVTADDILQVWNAVEKANPKLKEYIAKLSREEKVSIAKSAIKGTVPDWVTFKYEDIPTQDIREIYRKLVENEIQKRRLYERDKIMTELKDLSQEWKPFNIAQDPKYTKYRHSPEELYADAISVLLNEPSLLRDKAPSFHRAFFDYLERKPEVLKHYEEIQARINKGPDEVAAEREARMEAGMKTAEESWRKAYEPAAWEDKTTTKIKKAFSDRFASVYDFTKNPNTRREVENLIYEGAEQQFYINEVAEKVIKPIEKSQIKIEDLEKLYTLNAILKGSRTIKIEGQEARVSIANPYGISKETAPSILQRLKDRYGESGFKKLEEAQKAHWEIRQYIIDRLEEANMYPKELMDRIKDNEFYAHFLINDYITSKYGVGVGAGVLRQVGTLKANAPAFTATVMKDLSQLSSAQRTLAVKAVINDMSSNYPDFIKPAETQWNGKTHVPIDSKVKGEGLLSYMEEGKVKGFYVPEGVAEAFKKNPVEAWTLSKWLNNISHPFRQIFIAWNPGFWAFNLKRDFGSAVLTLPEATITEYAPLWFKAFVPALRDAFKGYDPTVQKMLKEKSLIPSLDYQGMLSEDVALERMLVKFALKDPTLRNPILNQFDKFFRQLDKLASASERVPKIAATRYLKEHFPNMSVEEVAERVRRAGSPPFLIKGQATPILNNVFLFSNAFIRGTEAHVRAIRENPAEYAWKQTKYTLIPKMLMWAGAAGLLGEGIKKIYELSSDYDKTNYFVIPLGTTKEGKGVTLRVPFDEQSRLLGGVFWKLATGIKSPQDAAKLFDYTAGQFPGVNPAFSMAADLISYLGGRNPYDSFRGRYAIPEMIFKAQDRRSVEAFAKFMAQQGGLGILYKFENDDLERVKGELEKVLGYPIVSNVLGRFIKVTDIGITEKIRKETEPIERELARINLDVKDALTKAINNKEKDITQKEIDSVLYKVKMDREDPMIKQFLSLLVKRGGGEGARYLEAYMRAQSSEAKAKIIEMMINEIKKK